MLAFLLLLPNGWMHQATTWYGGRPQPRRLCVRWGASFPPLKGHSPNLCPICPLWPNDWMDEDATWYGSRSRPRPHCVRRGPSSVRKKHSSHPHLFGPCLLWPRSPISATAELLLWPPYEIGQATFLPCGFFFLSFFFLFSSPNLSCRRLDVYHTRTHGVASVRI